MALAILVFHSRRGMYEIDYYNNALFILTPVTFFGGVVFGALAEMIMANRQQLAIRLFWVALTIVCLLLLLTPSPTLYR